MIQNTQITRFKRFLPLMIMISLLGISYMFDLHNHINLQWLADKRETLAILIAQNYFLSILGLFILYIVATATAFPAAVILTIGAGFLFGWFVAGIVVILGATIGATLLFLAAQSSFGKTLREKAGPKVEKMANAFENNAFSTIVVLRLAPILPFFVMNIAPALFRIPVKTYMTATLIGIAPGTFAFAYLGSGIESVILKAEAAGKTIQMTDLVTPQITLAFGALAAVAALSSLIKHRLEKKKSTLKEKATN